MVACEDSTVDRWRFEWMEERKNKFSQRAFAAEAECEALVKIAYFQPVHPDQWACRVCHHWHWRKEDIIHSDWCPVPQAEAVLAKVPGG